MRVLRINASTDYAVRILLLLADAGGVMPSSRLADSIGISRRYLLQVAAKLRETGLVDVVYGPTGGFKLTKALEQICLLDILRQWKGVTINFRNGMIRRTVLQFLRILMKKSIVR